MHDATPLIDHVVEQLRPVSGISAIVLGGSRAAGTHTPASDIDIGIYYPSDQQVDMEALRQVATALDDQHRADVVTPLGGWGPWINGGGWLTVRGHPVDILYRDLTHVSHYVAAAIAGEIEIVYEWGHPHAFLTSIYAAEIASCQVLWESGSAILELKAQLTPYPSALKARLRRQFGDEASFMVMAARHGLSRQDISYTAGCCFRTIACLMQVLFALNERFMMNEKGAVAVAATFPLTLPQLEERVAALYAVLAPDETQLATAVDGLAELVQEVQRLAL